MKRTFLALALAAQTVAIPAFAQTTDTTTGTTDPATTSGSFGSDWSTTLGAAMFAEDGTTVRSATELSAQWSTLSEEDKTMIRRDCMVHMQQPAGATDSTGTTGSTDSTGATGSATTDSTTTGDTSQPGTSGDAADAATGDAAATISVTTEQMDQICAATKDL
jgi:hypothetical protein